MENWLTQREKEEVIKKMIEWNLIKCDNKRKLPLKKGGTTDVFIMLRNARNTWQAQEYFGKVFANPLFRLGAESFIEVPSAVSGIAAHISTQLRKPYVTVRDTPKKGRVAKADYIGTFIPGAIIPIFDDVITNGASKLLPYEIAKKNRVAPNVPIVVLVDRQQGWQAKFKQLGIDSKVWAGMTLHDVRKYLIENRFMERCDEWVEENNPLIIAYDNRSWDEVLPIIDELHPTGCIIKVNDLALNEGIKNLIPSLQVYGRVMVDLKSHDISNTVVNIMNHIRPHSPWAVTVHASGSGEMVSAAVRTLQDTSTRVLGVTVLTSIDPETCKEIYRCRPWTQVKKLAQITCEAGAHGFVCSTEEVRKLKNLYPRMICVTPGIRSAGTDAGDQKRISTPAEALRQGADYIVTGRQILEAFDPVAEVRRLQTEELSV